MHPSCNATTLTHKTTGSHLGGFPKDSSCPLIEFFTLLACIFLQQRNGKEQYLKKLNVTHLCKGDSKPQIRATLMAQRFGAAFSPGYDLGDPGSSSTSGSLHGVCFFLCLCLCLSLSVSLMN